MSVSRKLSDELQRISGSTSGGTATLQADQQIEVRIDFATVDRISCAVSQIELTVPHLQNSQLDTLKSWAEQLCLKLTYLLENIGPVELDPTSNQVLIRSTPPDQQSTGTQFYEIILQSQQSGHFTLKRYRSEKGTPGRIPVDMLLTHEVLQKLVADLLDTVPTAP